MKYLFASLIMLLSISTLNANQNTTSLDDITLLTKRGLSDKSILIFLKNSELDFVLSAKNIDQLLQAGVSENIVQYLLQQPSIAPSSIASAPTPSPTTYITEPAVTYVAPYPNYFYAPRYINHTNHYRNSALQYGFATAYTRNDNRLNRHVSARHHSTRRHVIVPFTTPHIPSVIDRHHNQQRMIIHPSVLGHNTNKAPHHINKHPMNRENHSENHGRRHKQGHETRHQNRHNNNNNSHNSPGNHH